MISVEIANNVFQEASRLNPGGWTSHSENVAQLAKRIAEKAQLDSEKAYILGLLHDIGRRAGITQARHAIDGFNFMRNQCEEVARVCLTHTFQYKDIEGIYDEWDCTDEEKQMVQDYLAEVNYDDYDKLIQFCDAVSLADGYCIAEQKMVRSILKFGFKKTTLLKWQAILALKAYWDEKLGEDVYQCFMG